MSVKGSFEALKYSLRQSKDGVVISLVVHPSDISQELMALPIGARVEIEWNECTDEEPTITAAPGGGARFDPLADGESLPGSKVREGSTPSAASHKEHQRFIDMAPATQAALRCKDVRFQNWIIDSGEDPVSEELAAEAVRDLCHVKSRSALNTSIEGAFLWKELNLQYEAWLTQQDHAELVR